MGDFGDFPREGTAAFARKMAELSLAKFPGAGRKTASPEVPDVPKSPPPAYSPPMAAADIQGCPICQTSVRTDCPECPVCGWPVGQALPYPIEQAADLVILDEPDVTL